MLRFIDWLVDELLDPVVNIWRYWQLVPRRLLIEILGLFLIGSVLVYFYTNQHIKDDIRLNQEIARNIALDYANLLEININHALSASHALAAVLRQGKGQVDDFEGLGWEILQQFPTVSAVQLAPNGVIQQSVPLEGNEGAIGHNLFSDPKRNKEAFLARETGNLTLAGPFELLQGGVAVIGRLPVYFPQQGERQFWGFTTVLIRLPDLLNRTQLDDIQGRGYLFNIWRIHPDTSAPHVFAGSQQLFNSSRIDVPIQVPNGQWIFSMIPERGWTFASHRHDVMMTGLLLVLLVATIYFFIRLQPLILRKELESQKQKLIEKERQFSTISDNLPNGYTFKAYSKMAGHIEVTQISSGVETLLGIPSQQVIEDVNRLFERIDADYIDPMRQAIKHSRESLQDFNFDFPVTDTDGNHRWLLCRSRPQRLSDGSVVWDGLVLDNTSEHQQQIHEQFEADYRKLINRLSNLMIDAPLNGIDQVIELALKEVGEFFKADRAYIFEYDIPAGTTSCRYEWCSSGITVQIENLQQLQIAEIPDFVQPHKLGQPLLIPRVADLDNQSLKDILEPQDIQSMIAVPMMRGNQCVGFVGLDAVKQAIRFSELESGLLSVFAQLLVNVQNRQQDEMALVASRDRFSAIFEGSPDAIWLVNSQIGRIEMSNPVAWEMLEYEESELNGMMVSEIEVEHDLARIHQVMKQVREEGGARFESLHITRSGIVKDVEVSLSRIEHDHLLVAVIRDITSRKQAQQALEKTSQQLKDAQRLAQIGNWELDMTTQTLFWSDEVYRIFEIDPQQNKPHYDLFLQRVHPEDRQWVSHTYENSLVDQQPYNIVHRILFDDGRIKYVRQQCVNEFSDQDEPLRSIGTVLDITQLKLAEIQLDEERQRYRDILWGTNAGTWEWNIQTGETRYNERWAEIAGYSLEELQPISIKIWQELAHPDDLQRSDQLLQQHFSGETDYYEYETRIRHKQGHWIWVLDRGRVNTVDDEGKPLWMSGTHTDITERKLAQQREQEHLHQLSNLTENLFGVAFQYRLWPDGHASVPFASHGIEALFELNAKDVKHDASPIFKVMLPEDAQQVQDQIIQSASKLSLWHGQFRNHLSDGRIIWLEGDASPEQLQDGSVLWHGHLRDVTERKVIDEVLSHLSTRLAMVTGKAFLEAVCKLINEYLDLDHSYVGRYRATNGTIEIIAGWSGSSPLVPFVYAIKDTPCENVVDQSMAIFEKGVAERFPADTLLKDMKIQSYIGQALYDKNDPMGILVGLGKKPLANTIRGQRLMALLVDRVSAEMIRMTYETQLKESANVFSHANEAIMITEADGTILDVNQAFVEITGFGRDEVIGDNPRILKSGRHDDDFYQDMWWQMLNKGEWKSEIWNRTKSGEIYVALQTIGAVRDEEGDIRRFVSLFSDITVEKENQQRLEHVAHYDPLTDLPNRELLADRLKQGMSHARRSNTRLGVLYLDLDGFKEVNDEYGHDIGDEVLKVLSSRMTEVLREEDTLARIGGDEFVGVLTELSSFEASSQVLDRLLIAASEPVMINNLALHVTCSIGVSFYPQAEEIEPDQLMRQADQAMYMAKQTGKNKYKIFDADYDRAIRGHHQDVDRIREALRQQEFELYYQPKVNMASGEVMGVEALIRWNHPELGVLPPIRFLPVIDEDPLSVELGYWVIEAAVRQISEWKKQDMPLGISVNIDGYHISQEDFLHQLKAILLRYPTVSPQDLELEILESSALEDIKLVSRIIDECKAIGINIALDDFGTGYSTLTYLKRLPAEVLKIDQSFVRDMLDDPEDLAILDGVLGLAEAFRRQAIAEGVETVEHGRMLLALGCNLAQGYGIARPMPAQAIPEWLAGWKPNDVWLNQKRISADDVPILFSMVEHRAWVNRMKSYLFEDESEPPELHSSQCRFGRWLKQFAELDTVDNPRLKDIDDIHQQVHKRAQQLVKKKQAGGEVDSSEFGEIEMLRDRLLDQMQSLFR